jgi:hypothetical protein
MSNTGKAIYSRLTGTVAVSNLIGLRVYPHSAPPQQKTYPLAVYLDEGPVHVIGDDSTYHEQVSIATIASTYASAQAVSAAIRSTLHGQAGTWGGVVVHRALHNSGNEDTRQVEDESIWIIEQTFTVWVHV